MLNNPTVDLVFHALGDPTRRAIVERLSRGPASVSELAMPLAITLAGVGQHLDVLERSGLVRTEKVGRVRTCHVRTEGLRVAEGWVEARRTVWERRIDRLAEALGEDPEETKKTASRPSPRKKGKS